MVKLIEADTRLEAWMMGTAHLLDHGPRLNVVLAIRSSSRGRNDTTATQRIDEFLATEGQLPMHSVAETIFPWSEYTRRGLRGVFEIYPEQVYPSIKKHPSIRWGTYAQRLVRRNTAAGEQINPLKQMLDKMNDELAAARTKKSCYELGIAEGEYDLPLYSPARDGTPRMGLPCLSHLSFKLFGDAVHLTALYRSHDYVYKVPGNLLGLARLQACVARETQQAVGNLTVHSSYAFITGSKTRLRALLEDLHHASDAKEKTNDAMVC